MSLRGWRCCRLWWSAKNDSTDLGRRRLLLSLLVAIAGVAVSFSLFWLMRTRELEVAKEQFLRSGERRAEVLQHEISQQLNAVNTLAAYFAGSNLVERKEFRTFVQPLIDEDDGVLALGWAPRIRGGQRRRYERFVRDEGLSKYEITERDGSGKFMPAKTRDQYFPILYVEPAEKWKSLLGCDVQSIPECRAAIQRATSQKRPGAGIFVPASGEFANRILLFVAAPASNESPGAGGRPGDQLAAEGFVFGLFQIDAIAKSAINPISAVGIDVLIVAPSSNAGSDIVIYPSPSTPEGLAEAKSPDNLRYTTQIKVADRRWDFDCVALKAFWNRRSTWEPTTILLAGLLVTGFLVGYLHLLTGRTARIEKLVAERTRELHESEQRFRRLVDNAADTVILHSQKTTRILDFNERACESLGYTREELLSMTIADVDPDFIPKNLERYAALPLQEYPVSFEGTHRRKDGTTFPVDIHLTALTSGDERIMLGYACDITERKKAEKALDEERRLLRTMLDMHERDRKLVAYEIHDGLAQQLVGALYKFQSIEPLRDRDPDAARELFDDAIRLLRNAMAEARRLISGLRPPILDEAGIVEAVDFLISQQRQRGGPEIEFVHPEQFDRLAPPLESAIFRVVQECLTNACRYSQSERVRIELERSGDRVQVEVRDWGIGFEPAAVEPGHYGLQGIRQRAQILGGSAAIDSAPGRGTSIRMDLPLLFPFENGKTNPVE